MYHNLQGFKKNDNKQKYKKIKLSKEKEQLGCCLDNGVRLLCTLLSTIKTKNRYTIYLLRIPTFLLPVVKQRQNLAHSK